MTWFKVDDDFWSHPKVIGLPLSAIGLWTKAGAYSAKFETDGRLNLAQIAPLGGRRRDIDRLVEAGLWVSTLAGIEFVDWEQYQPTKAQIAAERKARAERIRKWREARRNAVTDAATNTVTNTVSNAAPVPVPEPVPVVTKVTRGGSRGGDLAPEPPATLDLGEAADAAPQKPKPSKKPKRAHSLPDDWTPNDTHRRIAAERGIDVETEAEQMRDWAAAGGQTAKDWDARFEAWKAAHPEQAALLERLLEGRLPEGWEAALPTFEEGKAIATRAASGQVLNAIAPVLPELWGGSADLAGSNNTFLKGEPSFLPAHRSSSSFSGDEFGRNLHFGVREFAMGAALNGIAADGLTRPYGGTFFVFSDFMRGAVRLAALMDLPVTYVWTHDSIGVGEDGPTHQPIEHLASYRAIPNLAVVRPADAAETAASWKAILEQSHPAAIILSRQNLPNPARGEGTGLATTEDLARGAYVLADTEGTPDVILLASGSEVSVALEAREALAADGIAARVVSVPCLDWFEAQDREYRDSVLPPSVRARVSVEAGLALPWYRWIGDAGRAVSIEHFGASAPGELLFKEYGIDAEHVTAAAKESIEAARS